jgi:hypothetical protein
MLIKAFIYVVHAARAQIFFVQFKKYFNPNRKLS